MASATSLTTTKNANMVIRHLSMKVWVLIVHVRLSLGIITFAYGICKVRNT